MKYYKVMKKAWAGEGAKRDECKAAASVVAWPAARWCEQPTVYRRRTSCAAIQGGRYIKGQ